MSACVHFAFLFVTVQAFQSSSLSCENTDVIHQHGAALLQRGQVSKSLSGATDEEVHAQIRPKKEFLYNKTKAKCCIKDMAEFITDLAVSMKYKICNPGFGPGLAHWHNCTGPGATSTFEDLKNSIKEWGEKPCSTITKASVCPDLDPKLCPVFHPQIHELPACEVCSREEAVSLDLANAKIGTSNLAGKGPTAGPEEISFLGIGSIGSTKFNLIVTAFGGDYDATPTGLEGNGLPKNEGYNKIPKEHEYVNGAINMNAGRSVDLNFSFQFDDGMSATLPELLFTIWDIDGNDDMQEYVTVKGFKDYVIDEITNIKVTNEDIDEKIATFSTKPKNAPHKDVRMDGTSIVLTPKARKAAVMMVFKDVSWFTMTFEKTSTTTDGKPFESNSGLAFNGVSSLEDHCGA